MFIDAPALNALDYEATTEAVAEAAVSTARHVYEWSDDTLSDE